jgi:hypothetical protein
MGKDEGSGQKRKPFTEPTAFGYWPMDYYFDSLKRIVASAPSGGTEFGEKVKSYAEKNLSATHEFMKQLSSARDFNDLVRLQTQFMQSQFEAMAEQTKTLGEAFTKDAVKAGNSPFKLPR